ncbi:tetratricopeptide repeat protein [Actinoplanes sp. NPDC051861]|uniref:tetratricopeptide repeat protein n=1 Tax=Actinoplanes sp. NPDC051861 TaxID=3155170 RepID=UPI00341971BF
MDADGTWHNLRPIAKLALSGPDQEPRRYTDTALGRGWFASKNPEPEDAEPTQAADGPVEDGPVEDEPAHAAPAPAEMREGAAQQDAAQPDDAHQSGTEQGEEQQKQAEQGEDEPPAGPELAPHLPLTAADLSAIRWRLDGATLREVVDDRDALRALGERLDGPLADEADNIVRAGLLSVRAEVYRLLGELGMAAAASRLALAHAESAHDLQSMVIAQAELAHVLRLRGDFLEADRLFQRAVDAEVSPAVRSVVHENAGRSCFDQGRHMEALDHFARAIRLGSPEDTDLAERIGVCLESVYIHVLRDGWGPYPRKAAEILGLLSERATDEGEPGALDEATAEQPVVQPRQRLS